MKRLRCTTAALLFSLMLALEAVCADAEQRAAAAPVTGTLELQAAEYGAEKPKTVLELQQFRRSASAAIQDRANRTGSAALVSLNPAVNAWFLLTLDWGDGRSGGAYHLENPDPDGQQIRLDPGYPYGLLISEAGQSYPCDLWSAAAMGIFAARASGRPFAPLCGRRLYLRNRTTGHETTEEWVTDTLREHLWNGESVISLVKTSFFHDHFLDASEVSAPASAVKAHASIPAAGPAEARIDPAYENQFLTPPDLGVTLDDADKPKMLIGHWYAASGLPGVFVSAVRPDLVAPEIKQSIKGQIQPLDAVELKALDYLVAFDLGLLRPGFAVGTEHPGVTWSDRTPAKSMNRTLPGPDGIGKVAPLVRSGMLSPKQDEGLIATFTGGYKRHHGAFKYGHLSLQNHASHYGFIENGVVMSKLQPELATFVVYGSGAVDVKTWTDADNADLAHVRFARQNGVPLIEYDPAGGGSRPSYYVRAWQLGNWSGAQDSSERTLRAGLCLQENGGRQFLIYGYFSSAKPSAMAQVFQSYDCRYAMHLDMNALEHTYLALYRREGSKLKVEHLVKGMANIDHVENGEVIPRFVGFADNRDFFYLNAR